MISDKLSGPRPSLITHHSSLIIACLTLLGFTLRLYLLNRFPFREDEAIYSVWALHFWHVDPLFLKIWPDKPPVFLWCLAAAFRLFGTSQASARWINVAFSTITIPVVAVTARRLWGERTAFWAALAFTLNPFAISFAATAYTDPLLVLVGSLAFYLALTKRSFWAGLWLGIAIMTKQQGVLYAPLVMGVLAQSKWRVAGGGWRVTRSSLAFLAGLCVIVLPIVYWDSLRWAVAPSPWDLSIRHYGELKIAPPWQWLPRLSTWTGLVWYLTASWLLWGMLVMLVAYKFYVDWRNKPLSPCLLVSLSPCLLVSLWSFAFFTLHVVTTVQPWDRYLLPLAPPVALLIGWLGDQVTRTYTLRRLVVAGLIGFCCLLPPGLTAAVGHLPIGGDHGAYTGLTDALTWLTTHYPQDVILYHQNLGWQERFYLYDQVATHAYELRWFSNAVYLANDGVKPADRRRFLVQPDWLQVHNLQLHLATRGLMLQERGQFGEFMVYEVIRLPVR
ncbi:MAG: glycosyltransferase family 39 protein [Caldilineaceae bacterium]